MPIAQHRRTLTKVHFRGWFVGGYGYARHSRIFARGLFDRGVATELEHMDGAEELALGEPELARRSRSVPDARLSLQSCGPQLLVSYPGMQVVNHTMFETIRVPAEWLEIAKEVAMTIVPTHHCYEAWAEGGTPLNRLRRVPLGVDANEFTNTGPSMELHLPDGTAVADRRVRMLHVSAVGFRKNQGGLLRAWLRATRTDDDAVLILKIALMYRSAAREFQRSISQAEQATGKRLDQAAPVLMIHDEFDDADMPALFRSATHYISASHGEGWDLPMIEAAATGLRLIAPDHSAYRDYLDAGMATMIPCGIVSSDPPLRGPFASYFQGNTWWQPDEEALVAAIRDAIDGKPSPDPRLAQAHVANNFTWDQSVDKLIAALEEVSG